MSPPLPETWLAIAAALVLALLLVWRLGWVAVRKVPLRMRPWARDPRAAWLRAVFARRLPRTYAFVARRLTPRRFSGLALTLTVAAGAYALALFAGLVEDLLEADRMLALDRRIDAILDPYRAPPLVDAFAWLTQLGGAPALTAVALVATGLFWAHRRRWLIAPLWVTIAGAELTTWLGKYALQRPRPPFVTSVTAVSPSFPSAHATSAAAVLGFVAYAIARDVPTARARYEATFWTLVLVAAIAFSRVYLSVHYASDVAAGLLVGVFWLLVGFALAETRRSR